MDIRQIKAALAVQQCKSFSEAAEHLSFSQSAVSKQVLSLENELGTKLFERQAQNVSIIPTAEGEIILERLRFIENEYNKLCVITRNMQLSTDCPVTLGSAPTLGSYGEDILMAEFCIRHPDKKIYHLLDQSWHLASLLQSAQIDCVVLSVGPVLWSQNDFERFVVANECTAIPLFQNPTTVGVYKDHPLAGRDSIELSELKNETFLIKDLRVNHEKSFSPRKHNEFMMHCQKAGFTPKMVGVDDYSNKVRIQMAKKGAGVILNTSCIDIKYEDIKFIPINDYSTNISYFIALKNNESASLAKLTKIANEISKKTKLEDGTFRA